MLSFLEINTTLSYPDRHPQNLPARLLPGAAALLLLLTGVPAGATGLPTADYGHLSQRPFQQALGGQMMQSMPVQAGAAVNPALLGYGEQNTFFAGGVFGPALTGFYADGALFSPFGGLLLSAEYLKARDQTGALRFGYGSFLSRRLSTGLSVSARYTKDDTGSAFGLGLDPALLFDSKWHTSFAGNDGWGLYSPSVFFRMQNLALPIGDGSLLASPSAHVGFLTGMYQSTSFNLALVTSTYGTERFDRLPLLVGVQAQYRFALLSLGYGASNFRGVGNGLHLGLGAMVPADFGDAYAFYAVGFANSERSELHSLTLGIRLGGVDREAPQVTVTTESVSFSPNNDGVRDLIVLQATVRDKSPIVFYEFRVLDGRGNLVYRQRSDERIREKDFSWSLFLRSFVAPRARSDIPDRFTWNGRMLAGQKKPVKDTVFEEETPDQPLADGTYAWNFRAIDEKNNESKPVSGQIQIDTRPPAVSVELDDDLISPNGDGRRDTLAVTQDTTPSDRYEGMIVNAQGEQIRRWQWSENAPARFDFDGRTDKGEIAEEGVYRYRLVGHDAAGNSAQAESGNFYISRRVDEVFLRSSALALNPRNPKMATIVFIPSVAFGDGYKEGEILITKQCAARKADLVYRIAVAAVKTDDAKKQSRKDKQPVYSWAGEGPAGTIAPDGGYCARFRALYENGNAPESPPVRISLDSSGPETEIAADLTLRQFTPDGDGEHEEQAFRILTHDQSPIESYLLTISELAAEPEGLRAIPVRRFAGQGEVAHTIYWDGKTESGALIESLTQYEYTLTTTDALGNRTTTVPRRFESGVLAVANATGFLVRLPYADLQDPVTERMLTVYRLLERYPKYRVKIEAHTALKGKIEQNLRLSEAAARKIRDFFIEQGMSPERVSYQGFGDSAPLYSARHIFAGKNRRVDIYLNR